MTKRKRLAPKASTVERKRGQPTGIDKRTIRLSKYHEVICARILKLPKGKREDSQEWRKTLKELGISASASNVYHWKNNSVLRELMECVECDIPYEVIYENRVKANKFKLTQRHKFLVDAVIANNLNIAKTAKQLDEDETNLRELLDHPQVADWMALRISDAMEQYGLSIEDTMRKLAVILQSDLTDYIEQDENGTISVKDIKRLDRYETACLKKLKVRETKQGRETDIEIHDRLQAIRIHLQFEIARQRVEQTLAFGGRGGSQQDAADLQMEVQDFVATIESQGGLSGEGLLTWYGPEPEDEWRLRHSHIWITPEDITDEDRAQAPKYGDNPKHADHPKANEPINPIQVYCYYSIGPTTDGIGNAVWPEDFVIRKHRKRMAELQDLFGNEDTANETYIYDEMDRKESPAVESENSSS